MTIREFGDGALLIELGDRIDPALVARASAVADAWERSGLGPAVPAYASVLVHWDPLRTDPAAAHEAARAALAVTAAAPAERREPRVVLVPTRYDGPDLAEVARLSGLSERDVVAAHTGRDHDVWFLGFMPGFAYCGPLDPRIVAPRLAAPRARVPAGAVAVADGQTAIYPLDSPGGWRLIGSTELRPFDPNTDPPALLRPGDRLRFVER